MCRKHNGNRRSNTSEFVKKAKSIHGDKYDYSRVKYINARTKVEILCPIHGPFWQRPNTHLSNKGCMKCTNNGVSTTEEFVRKAKEIHGSKYDYSRVKYINAQTKVEILCPIHGSFWQRPNDHLSNKGCMKCYLDSKPRAAEEFIAKAKETHGDMYGYGNVIYINSKSKVEISCKLHGPFLQEPRLHTFGKGCPRCTSSKGEETISRILDKNNIKYIREWWYPDETHKFRYDFYLPSHDVIIEYHGKQHYEHIEHFHRTKEEFLRHKNIDKFKVEMAKAKHTPVIEIKYIPYRQLQKPEFEDMLMKIVNNIQSRPRPKYNIHLLVEYNKNNNKYNIRYAY